MHNLKPTFFFFVLLVLSMGLLVSCSNDSLVEPITTDKGALDRPSNIDPPDEYEGITSHFMRSLNRDFDEVTWEEVDFTFDLRGDNVSLAPQVWPEELSIDLLVRTENEEILSQDRPVLFSIKVYVPTFDPLGGTWPVITGGCFIYKVSRFPDYEGVDIRLRIPLPGSENLTRASVYWLEGRSDYTDPYMFAPHVIGGIEYIDYVSAIDELSRPDNLTRMVLDPQRPGEDE